ncbi:MAG: efflux RND transporter periplasmic adaptor subunit [Polyangia bacterium]
MKVARELFCDSGRAFAAGLIPLLAGIALLGAGCSKDAPGSARKLDSVAVRIAAVTQEDLARRIGYVGTVHSRREVKVRARTAGAVLSLAGEGEVVSEGQTLARITAPEIAARASRMKAEVRRARTERGFTCESYETDRKLGEAGVLSSRQVAMSERACDAATAALAAARAGSREVGATRGKTSEQAPFGGLVLQWLVEPGQNVMPGTPLLILGGHELELRVQVAERDLERGVREGVPTSVRLGGESHRLPVSTVAPMAVGPARASEVGIPLPGEPTPAPTHGTSARVDFLVAEVRGAVAVPDKALVEADGASVVFLVEDGRARQVAVTPGIHDRGLIEVKGELSVGASVAVSNQDLLRDGASVFAVRQASGDEMQP